MHELLQFLGLDQWLQIVVLGSAILNGMSPVLVALAVETLITLGWVSSHFTGLFEIRIILYLLRI